MSTDAKAVLYTDGSSLGNPGPAGGGFVLEMPDGRVIERAIPLGETTVGVAEYRALIAGLSEASSQGVTRLHAYSDSQFLCRQLVGEYKVRSANIRPLYEWAQKLIAQLNEFHIEHTPREGNQRADALARQAAEQVKRDQQDNWSIKESPGRSRK